MAYRKNKIPMTVRLQLHRLLLFKLAGESGALQCYRCTGLIETCKELSIEHTEGWKTEQEFLDVSRVKFSHLDCNRLAGAKNSGKRSTEKTHCPKGHEYSTENTYIYGNNRQCKICRTNRALEFRKHKA